MRRSYTRRQMGYGLGVDLGTTFTSAAVSVDGRVEAVNLGTRTAVLPTVVFAREDGDVLVGDSAESRGVLDPGRVAREFKRRLGDTTPLILGGVAYSAEVLMGHVFEHVLRVVTERMGAAPDAVVVTHPATYTNYRLDLLRDAVARAGITNVEFMRNRERQRCTTRRSAVCPRARRSPCTTWAVARSTQRCCAARVTDSRCSVKRRASSVSEASTSTRP